MVQCAIESVRSLTISGLEIPRGHVAFHLNPSGSCNGGVIYVSNREWAALGPEPDECEILGMMIEKLERRVGKSASIQGVIVALEEVLECGGLLFGVDMS